MIQGAVNAAYEPVVRLGLGGSSEEDREVDAHVPDSTPLVGMRLLDGHNLNIRVETGGPVVIQAKG